MKKSACLLWVMVTALGCLGMGGLGSGIEIPQTAKSFSATLVDRSDLSISLDRFSCNGETFFSGKMGMADASVDFGKIRSVAFEKADDKMVVAVIQLKGGETVRLLIKEDLACYGAASVADVRILLSDIMNIEFKGAAQ